MMAKFPEADARMFHNMFICRLCKSKIKGSNLKVLAHKIKCRKCNCKSLRPKKKK